MLFHSVSALSQASSALFVPTFHAALYVSRATSFLIANCTSFGSYITKGNSFVQVPSVGIHYFCCVNFTTQLDAITKLAEATLNPIVYVSSFAPVIPVTLA